jgi:hypothetical protein
MAKTQASWVHGSGVQMEREGYFLSKARTGYGAHFNSHNVPGKGGEWFHFAIPTPVLLDGQRSTLTKIFVFYKTELTAKITAVHIYDAGQKITGFDGLTLSGDHSQNIDANNAWVITPAPQMKFGLGISIRVDFGLPTTGGVPGIWFVTAGADFETP